MIWQLFFLPHFCFVSTEKHYLKYYLTAATGLTNQPEFVAQMVVDNLPGGYCDSNGKIPQPRDDWAIKMIHEDPEQLELYANECVRYQHAYIAHIENIKQQFNQSGGIHIFQRIHGCEWDSETGEVTAFNQFGYDGQDFISLDSVTMTWVAAKPQALITKHKWDSEIIYLQIKKMFNSHLCPERLKIYLQYLQTFQQKKVQPSVFLLQKTPFSPVSCHVTGFYPENTVVFWKKDGQKLHEEVEYNEILPNHDGTFQRSVDLRLSSVSPEEWSRYECVFHLPGVQEDIGLILNKAVIRTNWVPPPQFPVGVVSGVTVFLLFLLLLVLIVAFFICKRKKKGSSRTSYSAPSSSEISTEVPISY